MFLPTCDHRELLKAQSLRSDYHSRAILLGYRNPFIARFCYGSWLKYFVYINKLSPCIVKNIMNLNKKICQCDSLESNLLLIKVEREKNSK